jgi:5-histidylcysteine sulfoxide synthase/putative 4-mercaptohistidine N1-methyltranferase
LSEQIRANLIEETIMHSAAKAFSPEMLQLKVTKTPLLDSGEPEAKREEIRRYFHATWELDERLFDTLASDAVFTMRADPLRHPLIFYYGHTAAFYINKLILAGILSERINPRFESMFAVGVDEMSWDDLNEAHYDWPTVTEAKQFRDQVRAAVNGVITNLPLQLPITWDSPFWAILMGIEHARIHLETSSVLIRQLPLTSLLPNPLWEICRESGEPPANSLLAVPGGTVRLGKNRRHPLYGWDNEFGIHEEEITAFNAARFLVSNGEFLEFVEDHGYQSRNWWTEEGWNWRQFRQAEHPIFWIKENGQWYLRTMLEKIDMPWNWPVEVNYLEAKAFCNWKSAKEGKQLRLPTEAEYYRLREVADLPDQPYWDRAPGNINLEYYASSCPVDRFASAGFYDVVGNVWQWTEMPIAGFHGFEVHPYYDDFSTPTFDTRHNLFKGGSWISTGNLATRDSRYAFRRHFFQHAGFRYVESSAEIVIPNISYETDELVSQYCEFQYGEQYFGVPQFNRSCVEQIMAEYGERPRGRSLDLGCATGRATFELARYFDKVTGLDFSARFIRIGTRLKEEGFVHYTRIEEGEIVSYHEKNLAQFGLDEVRDRTEFFQADASNLLTRYTGYDLVLAANLIDRLYDPARFLRAVHERINPGGLLVLTSPYTWLAEFTEKERWLGGFRKDGEPVFTLEGLKEILAPHFTLVAGPYDIPFVLRETRRKFQHTLSEMTVWEKR